MTLRLVASQAGLSARQPEAILAYARECIQNQSEALLQMAERFDGHFCRALDLILECRGRVVVCGIGKSGLVGRKIAATLACTGTPSVFLHAGEACHGDLGMVTGDDTLILISNSGETEEVIRFIPHFKELGSPIICLVGKPESTLAQAADAVLNVSVQRESCPHNLVPTTSTVTTLAMGDALAIAAMRVRNFTSGDFARFHPGGSLGRRLNGKLRDIMRSRDLPTASQDEPTRQALCTMSAGQFGLVIVVDDANRPVGLVTDGDVRRALQGRDTIFDLRVSDIMTIDPVTIDEDATLQQAEDRMCRLRIKALIVVNAEGCLVGLIEVFDDR